MELKHGFLEHSCAFEGLFDLGEGHVRLQMDVTWALSVQLLSGGQKMETFKDEAFSFQASRGFCGSTDSSPGPTLTLHSRPLKCQTPILLK